MIVIIIDNSAEEKEGISSPSGKDSVFHHIPYFDHGNQLEVYDPFTSMQKGFYQNYKLFLLILY